MAILLATLLFCSLTGLGGNEFFTEKKVFFITSSSDDAEENASGSIDLKSSDLELCDEKSNQTVGMRFSDVYLDSESKIVSAYLQFTTDEATTNNCSLVFYGELALHSASFQNETLNITQRNRTQASVHWQPEAWSEVNESGIKQQSPNLKAILDEVIKQPEWEVGEAISILVQGSGKRTAVSYDKKPEQAPVLIVELEVPINREPIQGVYINEVMSKNSRIQDEYGNFDDWLELYNGTQSAINLTGIYLSDSPRDLTKWQLQKGKILQPGEFMVLWADDEPEQGEEHLNFKLSSKGETIYLSQLINGDDHLIDYVTYPEIPINSSYARVKNGSGNFQIIGDPTPAGTNNNSLFYLQKPELLPESGFFQDSVMIHLASVEDDVTFRYSIDGSLPTANHPSFEKGMVVDSTILFKARAFKEGYAASEVVSSLILFESHHNLPVFNLSMDPLHLWDDSIGIYTLGTNGTTLGNRPTVANYYQDWERPCSVEMIESDGTIAFQESASIEIGGNASQGQPQKTLNIHFRKSYGADNVNYPVFNDLAVTEYGHLKLRNGGQDFRNIMVRDALNHTLLKEHTRVDVLSYRPAIVYLNGAYWGLYGLRESFNDDYVSGHYGYSKDSIDIVSGAGPWVRVEDGSDLDFEALYQFILNNDLQNQENFQYISEQIDINEYIDYHIAQLYYANYDWPSNNVRIWRNNPNGKWRWHMFDTDASTNFSAWGKTFPEFNSMEFSTSATSTKWPNHQNATLFMRKLFENDSFRFEFIQRTCTYISLIFDHNRVSEMTDSIVSLIDGEMVNHINKWSGNYSFGTGVACGGSYEQWLQYVNQYKSYFENRPDNFYKHMKGYFNLGDTFNLRIEKEGIGGKVVLNGNGVPIPNFFEAKYFDNIPLSIKAIPDNGFQFVKWKETSEVKSELTLTTDNDCILTAIFEPIGTNLSNASFGQPLQLFPNPIKGDVLTIIASKNNWANDVTIQCFEIMGKCQFTIKNRRIGNGRSIKIDVANLPPGTYFLKIVGRNVNQSLKFVRLN